MIATLGSRIALSILRARRGSRCRIDTLGEFHNFPFNLFLTSGTSVRCNSTDVFNFASQNTHGIVALSGTWEQSGTTLSRATGSDVLSGASDLYVFADGTIAGWHIAGSGTSITVSRSQAVAAQQLYKFETNATAPNNQTLASVASSRNFSSGVIANRLTTAPATFAPASSGYTLRAITQSQNGVSNINRVWIPIYPEVTINAGDAIVIDDYVYEFSYGYHEPVPFAVSPIAGLTGTGTMQRTRRITDTDVVSPTRIYLIADGNEITLPDVLGPSGTLINPGSHTIAETIVATGTTNSAGVANNMTQFHSCFGVVATGVASCKQVAWGSTTEIYGIVEYDTPVNVAAGKVLTVGMGTSFEPVIVLPPP